MLKISRSSRNKKLDKEKAGRIAVLAENQETLITAIEVNLSQAHVNSNLYTTPRYYIKDLN